VTTKRGANRCHGTSFTDYNSKVNARTCAALNNVPRNDPNADTHDIGVAASAARS
jgi:hypothetical protein